MAGVHFEIDGTNEGLIRKLRESRQAIINSGDVAEQQGARIENSFKRIASGAAALGIGFSIKEFASSVLRVRGEFQQLEVAFNTMLGSEEKANALMQQLVKTAATTPFDLQSVANGAKQLLAYGTSAEAVNDTLVQLGDIAAGLSIPLNDLVWLYGTTMTQGRLFTQDFRQFQSRGIPLADELAKQFGVTKDKVGELVTAGKVGFPEVQKAIAAMTSDGGKFGGLMEAQSKTITGQMSNIEDSISTMYNNIGKSSEGVINEALSGVSYLIANYEQVGKIILELAVTYGMYKAVLMSVAAYQSMAVGVTYAAEIAELSKLIPLKQQSANQDIIAAVNSGKLTQAKAEQVIALRIEIAAKIQSLQATEAQTKVEYASAMASYKVATQRMLLAKQNMAIAQSQMSIAIKSGTADEIAAAKKNAQTASLELNNASVAKNTTHKSLNIAATNSKSASEALNTLETGKNSVAQTVNTTSTNILTVAKTKLAAASKALGLSMLANPYVLAAAAVVGLGYGIYKLITYQTDAEKAQERLNKSVAEFNKQTNTEKAEIDRLFDKLRNTSKESANYQKIKDEITSKYGKYLQGMDSEILKLNDVEGAYRAISVAAKQSAIDRAMSEGNQQSQENWAEKQQKIYEAFKTSLTSKRGRGSQNMTEGQADAFLETFMMELKATGKISDETAKKVEKFQMLIGKSGQTQNIAKYFEGRLKTNDKELQDSYQNMARALGVNSNEYKNLGKETVESYIIGFEEALAKFKKTGKNQTVGLDGTWFTFGSEEELELQLKKLKEAKEVFNKKNPSNPEKKAGTEWLSSYKKAYEEAEKAYNDFLKSKQVMSDADRDAELKRLKENRDTAKTTYERKGGSVSSDNKQENQSAKLREEQEKYNLLLNKQALDQSRSAEDLQNQVDQTRINAMDEGSKKTLAQMELNFEKEMQTIDRQKEDLLRKKVEDERVKFDKKEDENAAKDPKYKKQTFDPTGIVLSDGENKQFDELYKAQIAEKEKEEKAYLDNLLEKHQDYTDKRLAIEKKFNADIAALDEQRKKAVENGDTQQVEQIDRAKAQATKDKGKELMGMDYDKLKESPDYVRAFENLKETSSETLNSLLSQLENAKGAAAKVLSPDQLREYTTTIQEIMDELDARNPFQSLSDKKKELAEAEQELADAQMALENARQTADAVKGGAQIENGVKSSKFNEKTGKIDSTKAYLTEAQALDRVKNKTDNYNDAKDKTVKKSAQVQKAEKKVKDVIGDLSDSLKGLGSALGGQAGEIINLIGDIGNFAMMAMSGVQGASTTASKAIQTVEKASVILAIISAAVQIATKIFDMFGKDDTTEKYEKAKEAYESYINILDRVIEKQLELAETLTGDTANAVYEAAIANINKQSENAKVLGKQYLNSGASRKSHSKGYEEVDDMSWEGWNQAAQALGMTIDQFKDKMGGRMAGLFDLTDEQLATLQADAGIFWSQLDSDTQNYADQVANGVAKVAEVVEQRIYDTTLLDVAGLRSDFQDLLTDMDASSADFADNFEGYMKDAIINSMIKDEYMDDLTAWREKFYNAMDDGVTKDEYNDLKKEGKRISDEMKAKQEAMKEMYGWTGEDDDEREASKKGIATASQDSVDENNGRLAVMQTHTYDINEGVKILQSNTEKIAGNTSQLTCLADIDKNMSSMMNLQNIAVSHLSNIENNTARLSTIEETMIFIKTGIDTLNTKGITLKR